MTTRTKKTAVKKVVKKSPAQKRKTPVKKLPVITLMQLARAGACVRQMANFYRRFGNRVEVDPVRAARLYRAFRWYWAASNLLDWDGMNEWRYKILDTDSPEAAREFARLYATNRRAVSDFPPSCEYVKSALKEARSLAKLRVRNCRT